MGKVVYINDAGKEVVLKKDCSSEPIAVKVITMEDLEKVARDNGITVTEAGKEQLRAPEVRESLESFSADDLERELEKIRDVGYECINPWIERLRKIGLRWAECQDCMHWREETRYCYEWDGRMGASSDATDCGRFADASGNATPMTMSYDGEELEVPLVPISGDSWNEDNDPAVVRELVDILRATYGEELEELVQNAGDKKEDPAKWKAHI